MTIHCFTSMTFSYLNRARVLGATLKKFHPDWTLWLCVTDIPPAEFPFDMANEPWDEVLYVTDLDIEDMESWLFRHDIVEACTAVKGPIIHRLIEMEKAEKVFYLDPDIAVFNPLDPLVDMLDESSILLTPHQLAPESGLQAIMDNEMGSLLHGTYNLGFTAIRNDEAGRHFAQWWSERCLDFCYDEKDRGLFVDQKWCDLVPALFDKVRIVRDPGYNVASWNLSHRTIDITADGQIMVNEHHPLRFYHFTKLGPIGDTMTRRYAGDNVEVYELWAWYKKCVAKATDSRIPEGYWFYGKYSNGKDIAKKHRVLYRQRRDLQEAFPNPFDASGYYQWLQAENEL